MADDADQEEAAPEPVIEGLTEDAGDEDGGVVILHGTDTMSVTGELLYSTLFEGKANAPGVPIVLMTDGQHDRSFRIRDWAYNSESEYAHWDRYNLWYYLSRYVNSWDRGDFYYQKYDAGTGDTLLSNICTAANSTAATTGKHPTTSCNIDVRKNNKL